MQPIQETTPLRVGDVLYHPTLGFSTVHRVEGGGVRVRWEEGGRLHPESVGRPTLTRGHRLCPEGGFFSRSVHGPSALRQLLRDDPREALHLLLRDVNHPLRRRDVEEWLVRRDLLEAREFAGWWTRVVEGLPSDAALRLRGEWVSLTAQGLEADGHPPVQVLQDLSSGIMASCDTLARASARANAPTRQEILGLVGVEERPAFLAALLDLGDGEGMELALSTPGWEDARLDPASIGRLVARLARVSAPDALPEAASAWRDHALTRVLLRQDPRAAVEVMVAWCRNPAGQEALASFLGSLPPEGVGAVLRALAPLLRGRADLAPTLLTWLERAGSLVPDLPELPEGAHVPTVACADRRPLQSLSPLPLPAWSPIALEVCTLLAGLHARGRCLGLAMERLTWCSEDGLQADPPDGAPLPDTAPEAAIAADLQGVALLLLDLLAGPLRGRDRFTTGSLLAVLNGLPHDLPPAVLGVLSSALAGPAPGPGGASPETRPPHGLELWRRLEVALAVERVRTRAPRMPDVRLQVGCDTHVGRLKMLAGIPNQDAVLPAPGHGVSFLAVCDGISQCTVGSGDLASGLAVRALGAEWERYRDRLVRAEPDRVRDFLDDALEEANRAICGAILQLSRGVLTATASMGTTAIVAVVVGNEVFLASLGDSRAYLVGDWGTALLTADQNLDLLRFQGLQRGESPSFEGTGKGLVGFLGHFSPEGRPQLLQPDHRRFTLLPGERLVLCSDGVTDYVASDEGAVRVVLGRACRRSQPQDACVSLVEQANRGGGGDNVSVLVACLSGEAGRPGPTWSTDPSPPEEGMVGLLEGLSG